MKSDREEFLRTTADFWSRRSGADLSWDDAENIIRNAVRFFEILSEWADTDRPADEPAPPLGGDGTIDD